VAARISDIPKFTVLELLKADLEAYTGGIQTNSREER
jgi:hypothetical protein